MSTLSAVLSHAPAWAWILLVALVAVGLRQTLPRQLTPRRAALLPVLLAALSLASLATSFGWTGTVVLAWAAGVAKTLLAVRAAGGWRSFGWSAPARRVLVPGSWLPLALFLSLFVLKFAVGATLALHPEFAHQGLFGAAVALACGIFAGLFLSRGLAMLRVARAGRAG